MKRQYSQNGSSRALLSRTRVIGGVVALVVIGVLGMRFFAPDALATLARPLWAAGTTLSAAADSSSAFFMDAAKLKAERDTLSEQNLELTNENRTLTAQLADVKQLVGTASGIAGRISAGVLARPPVAPYDVLIVGAGTSDGVRAGALAFGPGGVPIGVVKETTQTTARIALYSSPGTETSAWLGSTHIPITLVGVSAGAFSATLPKAASTTPGDTVSVPGPGALPIGTVLRVDNDPSSPTQSLKIQPFVNPFSIPWVLIDRTP